MGARRLAEELDSALRVLSTFDEGPDLVLYYKYLMVLEGNAEYAHSINVGDAAQSLPGANSRVFSGNSSRTGGINGPEENPRPVTFSNVTTARQIHLEAAPAVRSNSQHLEKSVTRDRKQRPWAPVIISACLVACSTLRRDDPSCESLLTVGRLFGVKEFDTDPLPARRWSKRAATYFTLEKPAAGTGSELIRTDPATGKKEVVVPAAAFVPEGAKEPLPVEAYEFSADESRLLVYTNSQRVWRRNTRGDYWLLDVAARKLRKLGGDAAPSSLMFATLSPDGTRVAFVRENNLYVQDLDGLKVTPLTTDGSKTLINGTSDWVNEEELDLRNCFRWGPDGRHLLFWQFDTTGVAEFHLVDNVVSKSPRVTSFAYPKVGEKNSAVRLGVIPAGGGKVRWLDLPGDPCEHYLPHADWTPDGSQILVQQFNRLQTELRVWRADPTTGMAKAVFTETDTAWLENENPWRWLGDGKSVLWLSERSGWRHAYRAPMDGTRPVPITKGEFDVIGVDAIDEAGGWLYYAASPKNATQRHIFRVKLDGSKTEQLSSEKQAGWHEYDFSPDAKWAVHTWSNFTTPPVVELVRLADNTAVRTITDNAKLRAKLAALKRPEAEFLRVPIGGGVTLDGWSMKPATVEPGANCRCSCTSTASRKARRCGMRGQAPAACGIGCSPSKGSSWRAWTTAAPTRPAVASGGRPFTTRSAFWPRPNKPRQSARS